MKIIDLNGLAIEVTDLKEAIRITKRYVSYRHEEANFSDFDSKQECYWRDLREKLKKIHAQHIKFE